MAILDLYKLQVFTQVAQAGSFSAAAERLYITQPAVSQRMHDLETALGTQLFQRGRRGVTLTAEGRLLLGYAERVIQILAEAEAAVSNVANLEAGQITLGATPGVSTYLMPNWLHQFGEHFPKIAASLQTATTPEVAALILAHQIELGFVEGELESAVTGRLESRKLCDVPQLVIVGQRHPLSSHARIALRDLDAQAFVMRQPGSHTRLWLDQVLRAAQVTPHVIAEFDNPEAIKRTVMNGKAVGILPEYAVRADVRRGMLRALPTEAPLARALSVIWDKAMPQSAIARAFLDRVDACLHEVG